MTTPDASLTSEPALRRSQLRLLGRSFDAGAVRAVLSAYLITRLMVLLIIFVSSVTIPMPRGQWLFADPQNLVLDGLIRYDSWWYTNIVEQGYSMGSVEPRVQGNAAFFPLYPLLVKLVAELTGNVFWAGVLISHVALLVALSYLYAFTRREFDDQTAARAVFYVAAAPTAIFFSAMYTESLYIALVCATFYYAREGRWTTAAISGALGAATRNTGILLAAVIALEGLHQQGLRFLPSGFGARRLWAWVGQQGRSIRRSWPALLAAAFVPIGLLAFMGYLTNQFGEPLGFITVQRTFGREVSTSGAANVIGRTIERLNIGGDVGVGQINVRTLLDVICTLGFALLALAVPFKLRAGHAVFAALTLLVPLASGTVSSMTRYVLMLIPCFIVLADWGRREWVDRVVVGIFLPLMAYFTVLFSHWYFAG